MAYTCIYYVHYFSSEIFSIFWYYLKFYVKNWNLFRCLEKVTIQAPLVFMKPSFLQFLILFFNLLTFFFCKCGKGGWHWQPQKEREKSGA